MKLALWLICGVLFVGLFSIAQAQVEIGDFPSIEFQKVPKGEEIKVAGDVARKIVNFVGAITGAIAVLYTIYGGVLYLTSGGNPDRAKTGKDAIVHGIVGIVIIVLAFLIVRLVITALTVGGTTPAPGAPGGGAPAARVAELVVTGAAVAEATFPGGEVVPCTGDTTRRACRSRQTYTAEPTVTWRCATGIPPALGPPRTVTLPLAGDIYTKTEPC